MENRTGKRSRTRGRSSNDVDPKRAASITLLALAYWISRPALGSDIQGIGGFALGDTLDPGTVVGMITTNDGSPVYVVAPKTDERYVHALHIAVNRGKRVARISAASTPMSAKECQQAMNAARKRTEAQFPSLGYYAMTDSDLFFEGDRSYTIECTNTDRGVELHQDFWDDSLEAK